MLAEYGLCSVSRSLSPGRNTRLTSTFADKRESTYAWKRPPADRHRLSDWQRAMYATVPNGPAGAGPRPALAACPPPPPAVQNWPITCTPAYRPADLGPISGGCGGGLAAPSVHRMLRAPREARGWPGACARRARTT